MGARHYLWMPAVLAGCSIIYNPDNLPDPTDAMEIDVPIDAPFDSNPDLLELTGVSPTSIDEGVGASGGRPAVIVLEGTAIVGAAQVSVDLMGSAEPAVIEGFDAVPDGTRGGVIVRIPVMDDLDAGMTRTLRITVTQGTVTKTQDVTVNGLDELVLSAATLDSGALATIYSQIEVASNIHFTGSVPVKLRATAGITVDMRVDGDATGATAGPHGCDGGAVDMSGGCGADSGGGQGTNGSALGLGTGSGGGGGGFGAQGDNGSGMLAGGGGDPSGNDMLVPIDTVAGVAGNRGNGGGGGGGGTLSAGGPGGGGGGVVLLEAGGDIAVGVMGALRAQGANGSGNGGSGGGGSGGAILVRSGGTITSPGVWLSAPGGMGGMGNNRGGNGAVGRIRVDAAAGDLAAMATTPPAVGGPAWAIAAPSLTTTTPLTVQLRGQPGRAFDLRLNDTSVGDTITGVSGTVDVGGLQLTPGRNRLCAIARSNVFLPESLSCIELFYAGN
jgi:hypothetical protein